LRGIEIESVAEEEMRGEHGGEQVVRGGDGVEVAVEVKIDLLARLHLGQAAAGRAALHAENRTQRWLAGGDDRLLADALQPLRQADGNHGFAFAGGGRGGGCDQDQFATYGKCRVVEQIQLDLGSEGADGFVLFG
jgi:hypothetical protein